MEDHELLGNDTDLILDLNPEVEEILANVQNEVSNLLEDNKLNNNEYINEIKNLENLNNVELFDGVLVESDSGFQSRF